MLQELHGQMEVLHPVPDAYISEWVRGKNSEMHAIAAFMGGVASQEAIKLLTQQYVPTTGIFVYDGMKATTNTFAL